jgi:cell division protein FtsL
MWWIAYPSTECEISTEQQEDRMERVERLSQAYSQAPWRKQIQILGLFLLIVVFIALIASIYLNVTARAGAIGRDILKKQSEMLDDQQKISDLKAQLGELYSTNDIERRARSLGFETIDPEEIIYLVAPGYVERQPALLAPAHQPQVVSIPELPAKYTESLFVWLQKQFNSFVFPLFKVRP